MKRGSAVLDTNVWLDWLVFADPAVDALRAAVRDGRLQLLSLARGRDELSDVLGRAPVRAQAAAARRRRGLVDDYDPVQALAEFDSLARILAAPAFCGLSCRDPDDQCFVDLAVAAGAGWLLSKDRALLALARSARRRFALEIAPPQGFRPCTGL